MENYNSKLDSDSHSSGIWKLYYYPVCPLSQKVHWLLLQYKIPFKKIPILNKNDYMKIWSALNFSPFPLLEVSEGNYLTESIVISEYINYLFNKNTFCINTLSMETITDIHFYRDVYTNIVYERTLKTIFTSFQSPQVSKINEGVEHLKKYLNYFENLFANYHWANKFQFSVADISLFTELMCLDYCGQVPWLKIPETKKWYMRLKHREEARILLEEHIGAFKPPAHYDQLDF